MTRIRSILTAVLTALALIAPARASTLPVPLAPSFDLTATAAFTDAYTFRGSKLAGQSAQPSLDAVFGDLHATIWANRPLAREADPEIDFTAGLNGTAGPFNVDLGLTAYRYPGSSARTTWEPYLALSKETHGFTVTATGYYDLTLHARTFQGAVAYTIKTGKRLTFTPRFTAGITRAGGDSTTYWESAVEAAFTLTERAALFGTVLHTSSDDRSIQRDIRSFNAGARLSF